MIIGIIILGIIFLQNFKEKLYNYDYWYYPLIKELNKLKKNYIMKFEILREKNS